MAQIRGQPDFSEEPLGPQGLGQLRIQDLHRDLALMLQVPGQVDPGHPAAADLGLDELTISKGRLQEFL